MATDHRIEDKHLNNPKREGKKIIAFCPFHDDKNTPNLHIFDDRRKYKCFAGHCDQGGTAYDFLKRTDQLPEESAKQGRPSIKPTENDVTITHKRLLESNPAMRFLEEKRGWNRESIVKYKIGLKNDFITFPIRDYAGHLLNIRLYNAKKLKGLSKFMGWAKGYGARIDLFPADHINSDYIILCEGEPDAILARQLGFDAVAFTGGVGSIKSEHLNTLAGREITVVFDIDEAGRKAAARITRYLARICPKVKNLYLPITEPSNGDFTDFILGHQGGKTGALAEFKAIKDKTPISELPMAERAKIAKMEPVKLLLEEAALAKNVGSKQQFTGMVSGKDSQPYLVPKKVLVTCSSSTNSKRCNTCQLFIREENEFVFGPYDPEILQMIGQPIQVVRGIFRLMANIPKLCTSWTVDVLESQNVETLILIPEIDYNSDIGRPYVTRTAYIVSQSIAANKAYSFIGWTAPDPNTHHAVHLIEKAKPTISDIDSFELTSEMKRKLEIFQAVSSVDIEKKLDEIYSDFEDHVSFIWGRRDLLIAIDIAYHSAIRFKFDGRMLRRGWIEVLILGDTRCGKSETAEQIRNHYRAGEMVVAENMSFAGLVGGVNVSGNRKYITWGKLPLNDGRLIILDEFSEMPIEEIGRLSGVRSSGVAQITKILTEQTMARVRLIVISNPRRLTIQQFSPGVAAVKDLIVKPEDIARFDMAITLASNEVSPEEINRRRRPRGKHVYTSSLCTNRLKWVWSRGDKIKFTTSAVDAVLDYANELAANYHPAIPLVEPSEVRIKLARISVSIAGMVCSTEDWETIIVTKEHVYIAWKTLVEAFNKPSMRYDEFSKSRFKDESLENPKAIKRRLAGLGVGVILDMLDRGNIQLMDLEDWAGERREAKSLASYLVKARCIKKPHSFYVKTPAFNNLLRSLVEDMNDGVDLGFNENKEPEKSQEEMPF